MSVSSSRPSDSVMDLFYSVIACHSASQKVKSDESK